jgi:hypothetical protein
VTTAPIRFSPYDYKVHEDPYPLYARLSMQVEKLIADHARDRRDAWITRSLHALRRRAVHQ